MRRIIVTLAILVYSPAVLAQESDTQAGVPNASGFAEADRAPEPRKDRGGFIKHNGWYLAPTAGVTTVNGEATAEFGLRGAWLINRRFGIGLAGIGWADGPELEGRNTDGGYGGVLFQYVFASESFLHATTQTVLGGGAYCATGTESRLGRCKESYGFFASDSTLNLEMNVNDHMRITVGGGYRFVIAEDASPISSKDLRGFVARTSVELGRF